MRRLQVCVCAITLFTTAAPGCGSDAAGGSTTGAPPPASRFTCVDDDLEEVFVFGGAGYDAETGLVAPVQDRYVVSTLLVEEKPGAGALLQKYALPVITALPKQEGLVGWTIASSDKCGSSRILTVWRSEEALVAFFVSDTHSAAMSHAAEVAETVRSTHWEVDASAVPPAWQAVRERVDGIDPITY
jgi:hypothetical protein